MVGEKSDSVPLEGRDQRQRAADNAAIGTRSTSKSEYGEQEPRQRRLQCR